MRVRSLKIESPVELTLFHIDGHTFGIENLPNPNCKWCYGRGYVGKRRTDLRPVLCRCVGHWEHRRGSNSARR